MDLEVFADKFLDMFYTNGIFSPAGPSACANLSVLYCENSRLTFENNKITGVKDILEKYSSLPQMRFKEATRDVQPSAPDGSVLISINGYIIYEGTEHPQMFNHVFHLVPEGGQWYILNDIFRIVYPPPPP